MLFTRDFLGLCTGLSDRTENDIILDIDLTKSKKGNENCMEGSGDSQWLSEIESKFPVRGNTGATRDVLSSSGRYPTQNGGQLTIFYAGNINVFENVTIDKAQAIMSWATKERAWPPTEYDVHMSGSNCTPYPCRSQPLQPAEHLFCESQPCQKSNPYAADRIIENSKPPLPHIWNLQEFPLPDLASSDSNSLLIMVPQALPQARKASLERFLERRKQRMQMMCPYFKRDPAQGQQHPPQFNDYCSRQLQMAQAPF